MTNSRVRVRVPAPLGELAPRKVSVRSVVVHAPRVPITPASVSADAGTTWRWAISVVTLPRTWSASVGLSGGRRSASSWVPSSTLRPAERPRPKRRTTPARGDGGELVDQDEGGHRFVPELGGDRQEVLD